MFNKLVENHFKKKIKIIQCDGGGEYKRVQRICVDSIIQFRMSYPYTS